MSTMTDSDTPWLQKQVLGFMRETADSALKRGRWDDEPPQLWLIAEQPKPLGFSDVAVAQMPVPDVLWDNAPPAAVLLALAQSFEDNPSVLTPKVRADLYGIVLLSETWDLAIPEDASTEEKNQALVFCETMGVADHPWGVEAKTMFAVDIDGWDLYVSRRRGAVPNAEWASPPGTNHAGGRIPDGLHKLLGALR